MVRFSEFNLGPLQGTHLMNERIKYLAIKSGLDFDGYGYPIWGCLAGEDEKKEFLEKFAMSIVRECLAQVRDEVQYISDWDKAEQVINAVKKHFGVSDERTN